MRGILAIFAVSVWAGAGVAVADGACSGDACGVVTVSGDGCLWTNKGDKAVRFSLIAAQVSRMVTVLAPGESFKEADKAFCVGPAGADRRYQATFATLSKMPEEAVAAKPVTTAAAPVARAKPAAVPALVAAVAPKPAPLQAPSNAVASLAPVVPLPRVKPAPPPAYPPLPRVKPAVPVEVAAPAVVAPVAAVAPSAAVPASAKTAVSCADGSCPPILFKVIDNCLWVLNLNPRPVAFEAEIAGKMTSLALEAADGEKADARSSALASGTAIKDDGTLHMRLRDPFQSAGSGIPVYRARLGAAGACVKDRAEIARFQASYVK